uniref:CRAL-TRIO domain-containing protein n=1 Tax=Macrostomum lignano TaxID=282301 RepID=A0A1I8FQJ0_9PLAT
VQFSPEVQRTRPKKLRISASVIESFHDSHCRTVPFSIRDPFSGGTKPPLEKKVRLETDADVRPTSTDEFASKKVCFPVRFANSTFSSHILDDTPSSLAPRCCHSTSSDIHCCVWTAHQVAPLASASSLITKGAPSASRPHPSLLKVMKERSSVIGECAQRRAAELSAAASPSIRWHTAVNWKSDQQSRLYEVELGPPAGRSSSLHEALADSFRSLGRPHCQILRQALRLLSGRAGARQALAEDPAGPDRPLRGQNGDCEPLQHGREATAQSLIEFGLRPQLDCPGVERFAQGGITSLTSNELYMIVKRASVIDVRGDCGGVGNLHGSIEESLQAIFPHLRLGPSDVCYVFLGDYLATTTDKIQTNVFVLLLIFNVTTSFTASLYREFKSVFKYLPLAARANGVHLDVQRVSQPRGNLLDLEQVVRPCHHLPPRTAIMRLLARQPSRLGDHTLQADPLEDFDDGRDEDVWSAISFMKRSNMKICVRNEGIEQSLAARLQRRGQAVQRDLDCVRPSNIRASAVPGRCAGRLHRNCASTLHPTDPKAAKPDVRLIMYCPNK